MNRKAPPPLPPKNKIATCKRAAYCLAPPPYHKSSIQRHGRYSWSSSSVFRDPRKALHLEKNRLACPPHPLEFCSRGELPTRTRTNTNPNGTEATPTNSSLFANFSRNLANARLPPESFRTCFVCATHAHSHFCPQHWLLCHLGLY